MTMVVLKDIATRLNISISTVSRVLNNDKTLNVPESTREKIQFTAKEMGYIKKPKKASVNAKTTIGVIMWYTQDEVLNDPYFIEIRRGIERIAEQENTKIVTIYKQGDHTYNVSLLEDSDGIIAIGKFSDKHIKRFHAMTKTIVFVDSSPNDYSYASIVIDFRHAMKQVIHYILSLQEKHIAYLGAYEKVENEVLYGERRKKFFLDVLKRQKLYQADLIKIGVFNQESGYKNMQKILHHTVPDVVFCANDSIAYGALKAIHEKGLQVPKDVKIIGFNDNTESRYITPSLTTLHVPTFEMGEEAFLSCMQMIKRPNRLPVKKVLPTKLIIRHST